MALKKLDPNKVRELLNGVPDVLTPAIEAEHALYKNARCPRCFQSGHCSKRIDPPKVVQTADGLELAQTPFHPGSVLADGYARCTNCDTDFCPRTGIIRHTEPFLTAVQP